MSEKNDGTENASQSGEKKNEIEATPSPSRQHSFREYQGCSGCCYMCRSYQYYSFGGWRQRQNNFNLFGFPFDFSVFFLYVVIIHLHGFFTTIIDIIKKSNPFLEKFICLSAFASAPITFRMKSDQITSASPPQLVSLEDIMKAAHGMQNMALAHEIALESDFMLQPFQPPENSLEKILKDTLHKAFFDILRRELNSDPPEYRQAMVLLEDVKKGLYAIMLPTDKRFNQVIEEVLDPELIRQQAENNALDFAKYANFVIDIMGKLCAPIRDQMIGDISKIGDTVDSFRAILEALEVLKLDLANTLIARVRPHIQANSVEYEKQKFEELLKFMDDGLHHTREWLLRHLDLPAIEKPVTDETVWRNALAQALVDGYLELFDWNAENEYPETLQMDSARFATLAAQTKRVLLVAAVCLLAPNASSDDPNLVQRHKTELKQRLLILTNDDWQTNNIANQLPALSDEVIRMSEEFVQRFNYPPMNQETKDFVKNNILALKDKEHRVNKLVWQRTMEFFSGVLKCSGGLRPVPPGLSTFADELTALAGTLLRYVLHNKAVYMEYYADIVQKAVTS